MSVSCTPSCTLISNALEGSDQTQMAKSREVVALINTKPDLRRLLPAHAGIGYSGVAIAHGFIYWVSGGYLNAWSLP